MEGKRRKRKEHIAEVRVRREIGGKRGTRRERGGCSSMESILASRAATLSLCLPLTAPSISPSRVFRSLFCLSRCSRAASAFWANVLSPCSCTVMMLHSLLFPAAGGLHLGLVFLEFSLQLLLGRHRLRPLSPLLLQLDLQLLHLAGGGG
ncbi:hypothetical protein EYF80_008673 [Liparis tanakae]|uniref:Uncharacterized protein n=1 Tax=Liparis tanakae TaxID=230148 RepID=A0A4Z2ITD8_9TELE|nr:hypothetical protein EYF80_008673 [Liparis tanakae]